ncbi:MAG: glycosyltransferase [Rhodobacterales bacterium]
MRAPISIILPTLDARDGLAETIPSLMEGLEAGLVRELILSDGGSTDATRAVADAAGAIWLSAPVARAQRLRRGADAARGEWLMFLEPGVVLSPGWTQDLRAALKTPGAHHFRLRLRGKGLLPRIVGTWANLRAARRLPDPEHGLLIHRSLYDAAGGHPDLPLPDVHLAEDIALARALGARFTSLPINAAISAAAYAPQGLVRREARTALSLLRSRCTGRG